MKKTLLAVILLLAAALLFSCSDAPATDEFSYEKIEGGYEIVAVKVLSHEVRLPDEYMGEPVLRVAEDAFYRNTNLRSLYIPAGIAEIGVGAFADCENLHAVVFEEGGHCKIGDSAFEGCLMLKKLTLSGSVCAIGDSAFKGCKRLSGIEAGNELQSVGENAFLGCEQLIVHAEKESVLETYAAERHLATSFRETPHFLYLELSLGLVIAIAVLVLWRVIAKKRKKKQKQS